MKHSEYRKIEDYVQGQLNTLSKDSDKTEVRAGKMLAYIDVLEYLRKNWEPMCKK